MPPHVLFAVMVTSAVTLRTSRHERIVLPIELSPWIWLEVMV